MVKIDNIIWLILYPGVVSSGWVLELSRYLKINPYPKGADRVDVFLGLSIFLSLLFWVCSLFLVYKVLTVIF